MLLQSIQMMVMHICVSVALLSAQTMSTVLFVAAVLNSALENTLIWPTIWRIILCR